MRRQHEQHSPQDLDRCRRLPGCAHQSPLANNRDHAQAAVDEQGIGGQTPIFHAVTQFDDGGFSVAQLLLDRGADLTLRAKLPGHYEHRGTAIFGCAYLLQASDYSTRRWKRLIENCAL